MSIPIDACMHIRGVHLHACMRRCDVLKEEETKWSANFWLWNKPYHFMDAARRRWTEELAAESL